MYFKLFRLFLFDYDANFLQKTTKQFFGRNSGELISRCTREKAYLVNFAGNKRCNRKETWENRLKYAENTFFKFDFQTSVCFLYVRK